jgi:hypothetical protein
VQADDRHTWRTDGFGVPGADSLSR